MANSGWQEMALGDFVTLQRGHDLPAAKQRPGNVPVMGSAGQNGCHDTARAKGPGIVIGRSGVGSMGVVSYCPVDYWPHNTVLYVTNFRGNDARFSFYFLSQLDLRRYNFGSAQASLNRNYIYPIRITVPRVEEQKRIADILGTLDDKIELNRRMNETLEAMTRRYLYFVLVSQSGMHQLLANISQTGVPAISRPTTSVKAIKVVLPPKTLLSSFEKISNPLTERVSSLDFESEELTRARDRLLPQLLSGELNLSDKGFCK